MRFNGWFHPLAACIAAMVTLCSAGSAGGVMNLEWSTYAGGSFLDMGWAVTHGQDGSVYAACETSSFNFPVTSNAYDNTCNGVTDTGLMRLTPDGRQLIYSTFLGGTARDVCRDIVVDASGQIFLAGSTNSDDFPVSADAPDTCHNGWHDAYIAKFDSTGQQLLFSTYLGGSLEDKARGIALLGPDLVAVSGHTESSDFPVTPGCYQSSWNGEWDTFIAIVDVAAGEVRYATYLGGTFEEEPWDLAVGPSGDLYVTGYTLSSDFPATPDAFDLFFNGAADVFVTRIDPTLTGLVYSTFIGGPEWDRSWRMRVDDEGRALLCGQTASREFPVTPGAWDTSKSGCEDAFVLRLNAAGSALDFSSFLGGQGMDVAQALAVDERNLIAVAGYTFSPDFPVTPGVPGPAYCDSADVFVSVFNASASQLLVSSYLGGSAVDQAFAAEFHGMDLNVTGLTRSGDFPTTEGAFDRHWSGESDAFAFCVHIDSEYCDAPLLTAGGLSIRPAANPAGSQPGLVLVMPAEGPVALELFDSAGRCGASITKSWLTAGTHLLQLPRCELAPGLYLVRVTTPAGRSACKIACIR